MGELGRVVVGALELLVSVGRRTFGLVMRPAGIRVSGLLRELCLGPG